MKVSERHRYYVEIISPALSKLAARICDATRIDDPAREASRYGDLLAFYGRQTRSGYWHPALTESVADFTAATDPTAALPYYRLALQQARKLADKTYTILIAMAECLFELGQRRRAKVCLQAGRAEALRRGDRYFVREADRISREARKR
jgi:hypothetical protein